MNTPEIQSRPTGPAAPIYDHDAGIVHVPFTGRPGFAVLDLEDFEVLRKRTDIVMSPLRLGRHHDTAAVRARIRMEPVDGYTPTALVCNLVMRPAPGHYVVMRDGNPLNLRRSNLETVRSRAAQEAA